MKIPIRSVLAINCLIMLIIVSTATIMQPNLTILNVDAQTDGEKPSDRNTTPIVYDSESDRSILFGGWTEDFTSLGDTWAYDLNTNTWENKSPLSAPGIRGGHAFAYDEESDRVILFSGQESGASETLENWNDTWAYDYNTNTWENLEPINMPPPRLSAAMVYDSESDVCILFGGIPDGGSFVGDTWAYDYNTNTWTNMSPLVSPSNRVSSMAYDIESDRVVLYGGGGYIFWPLVMHTDTWVYDYNSNTWSEMTPADNPLSMGMITYDEDSDVCVFHGGTLDWYEVSIVTETWTYDYNTNMWTQIDTEQYPEPRSRIGITYDSESDCVILHSGGQLEIEDGDWENATYDIINDLWIYDANTETWEKMYPLISHPFDPVLLLIIGGGVTILAIVILFFIQGKK
ncbi:MAG: Kelch repeat-containing protein [Promethearchaeota archaeon]